MTTERPIQHVMYPCAFCRRLVPTTDLIFDEVPSGNGYWSACRDCDRVLEELRHQRWPVVRGEAEVVTEEHTTTDDQLRAALRSETDHADEYEVGIRGHVVRSHMSGDIRVIDEVRLEGVSCRPLPRTRDD